MLRPQLRLHAPTHGAHCRGAIAAASWSYTSGAIWGRECWRVRKRYVPEPQRDVSDEREQGRKLECIPGAVSLEEAASRLRPGMSRCPAEVLNVSEGAVVVCLRRDPAVDPINMYLYAGRGLEDRSQHGRRGEGCANGSALPSGPASDNSINQLEVPTARLFYPLIRPTGSAPARSLRRTLSN